MNYTKMMRQIEKRIEQQPAVNVEAAGSGLLSRNSNVKKTAGTSDSIVDEVAGYISAIRKQKEELMSGKQ